MRLIILGAGGYGQTVADLASQLGRYDEILFLDDNAPSAIGRCQDYEEHLNADTEVYPAFGNNETRLNWVHRLMEDGVVVPTLVHPTAYISPKAVVESGNVVLPKAVINTSCHIGKGCIINCGALIDHGCVIEDGVHICLGAIVKGDNRIKSCTKIEAGEVIQARIYPV